MRDIDDYRVNAVHPAHLKDWKTLHEEGRATDGFLIPAPRWAVTVNNARNLPPITVQSQYPYTDDLGLLT